MGRKKITVSWKDKTISVPQKTTYREIVDLLDAESEGLPVLGVVAGGKLAELHKEAVTDVSLRMITPADSIGWMIYRRTACLILFKAIADVCGPEAPAETTLCFDNPEGYFFTLGGTEVSVSVLDRLSERMLELIRLDLPVSKAHYTLDEAERVFREQGMNERCRLLRYRMSSGMNMYTLDGYSDYFYGNMADRTGVIGGFSLLPKDEGFILRLKNPAGKKDENETEHAKIFRILKDREHMGKKFGIQAIGDLNDLIASGRQQELILMQEALQESDLGRIAETITERSDIRFVLTSGPSSSGKTSFSHRLSSQLSARGKRPHPIALDDYFVERDKTPLDENGEKDYECLDAIDIDLFQQNMLDLLRGEAVSLPEYDFVTGQRKYRQNKLKIGPEDVLVIEGIHGLNDRLISLLPFESCFRIFISALTVLNIDEHNIISARDLRLLRRMVRDERTRGTTARQTISRWDAVCRGEDRYILPFAENADIMFNSALIYEAAVLKVYAQPLLFSIRREDPEYLEARRLLKFLDYVLGVPSERVPYHSLLREFIGGSVFKV